MPNVTNTALLQRLHELELKFTEQNATIVARLEGLYDACPHQVEISNGRKAWELAQALQSKLADHRVEMAKHVGAGALGGGVAGAIVVVGQAIGWW